MAVKCSFCIGDASVLFSMRAYEIVQDATLMSASPKLGEELSSICRWLTLCTYHRILMFISGRIKSGDDMIAVEKMSTLSIPVR